MLEELVKRIELLENKDEIINAANTIVEQIMRNPNLEENEKLLVVDLINAIINERMYKS
ncbi:MAG: hypothetical protein J6A17_03030 [Bacilli bacterium]|nr:hypothetical protein [Bacilli bacterium]MBQ8872216.1 hypothetical protein [Bacilli bacterium]